MLTCLRRFAGGWRLALARASGAGIGPGCTLGAGCDVQLGFAMERRGRISLGRRCTLEQGVVAHPYGGAIILGDNVFIGPYTVIYGHGGVTIGADTLVSMHCRILSSNHTVPAAGETIRAQPDLLLPTAIGRDVWLGAGVTILGGVTVGDGCVVGAGAVVTKDLPPHSVAMGVPAAVVRQRI
jgi:acetyltransferase-like isoleucine patch superfamily enzyme